MEQLTMESLVTARVVSKQMGMAQSQVYRLAKQRVIPSYTVGARRGAVRFDLREVKEALRRPAQAEAVK
jgi:predicted DNA-binding transcriptional regulator AlpA